ncbi:hypothetical protein ACA910_008817 [Epithemia clementina (nom. ined.)]
MKLCSVLVVSLLSFSLVLPVAGQGCSGIVSVLSKEDHQICASGSTKNIIDELNKINICVLDQIFAVRRELLLEDEEHDAAATAATLRGSAQQNQRELPPCSPLCRMCSSVSSYWFCADWCRGCYRRDLGEDKKEKLDLFENKKEAKAETKADNKKEVDITPIVLTENIAPEEFEWEAHGMMLVDNTKCVAMMADAKEDEILGQCLQASQTAVDAACVPL